MIRLLKDINSGKNKAGEQMSLLADTEERLIKGGWAEAIEVEKPKKEEKKKETPKKKEVK